MSLTSLVRVAALVLHGAACAAGPVTTPVNLEGTWKIVAPQSIFKPEGGAIPFTKAGAEAYRKNKELQAKRRFDDYDYAISRCSSPGTARLALTSEPFRVWQRPGMIIFQYQWNRLQRQVDMGGMIPQIRPNADDKLAGRAIPIASGHWEGQELVLISSGFNDATLVDALVPHGWDLKVTERLRLKDADTLEDRLTIEDPENFTRPWQTTVTYRRQPDAPFREDVCLDRLIHGPASL